MTKLLLIRHGAHDLLGRRLAGRNAGVHINERGKQQAHRLADRLENTEIAGLYSSPMERCVETAMPLAERLRVPITSLPALTEVDFGTWSGQEFSELDPDREWKHWNSARASAHCPGGESMRDAQKRIVSVLEKLRIIHDGETVAVVSHSDMIKAALMHYLVLSLDRILNFEISPASVSVLHLADWGSSVVQVNGPGILD